ncbi:uncharacterized protein LOC110840287 isoform X2 [Zootermopsis nevadensis]|uniref:uncharacterized protein LOC110840287 isoform X1 n=1 Tax=Zootermopsis nevadensis TaxID=136037 RepID=UPI000B8E4516|nr:uncharacterized protein LOC110840287 isoform X1 [Zootermopsis nevadensis]XP_021940897.1 uncharacterized protein LOC110840287 isoform X1 [Zootermopsis nevadensis]XP_021940898.1 uncharacterized protein LOC110840287 isoform X1 [Zootermopsis nevadensis]XP_021940899.1 uncharacterized protein LOC110840287 isoform X2 [Zootermopsis nevadensis]
MTSLLHEDRGQTFRPWTTVGVGHNPQKSGLPTWVNAHRITSPWKIGRRQDLKSGYCSVWPVKYRAQGYIRRSNVLILWRPQRLRARTVMDHRIAGVAGPNPARGTDVQWKPL